MGFSKRSPTIRPCNFQCKCPPLFSLNPSKKGPKKIKEHHDTAAFIKTYWSASHNTLYITTLPKASQLEWFLSCSSGLRLNCTLGKILTPYVFAVGLCSNNVDTTQVSKLKEIVSQNSAYRCWTGTSGEHLRVRLCRRNSSVPRRECPLLGLSICSIYRSSVQRFSVVHVINCGPESGEKKNDQLSQLLLTKPDRPETKWLTWIHRWTLFLVQHWWKATELAELYLFLLLPLETPLAAAFP